MYETECNSVSHVMEEIEQVVVREGDTCICPTAVKERGPTFVDILRKSDFCGKRVMSIRLYDDIILNTTVTLKKPE